MLYFLNSFSPQNTDLTQAIINSLQDYPITPINSLSEETTSTCLVTDSSFRILPYMLYTLKPAIIYLPVFNNPKELDTFLSKVSQDSCITIITKLAKTAFSLTQLRLTLKNIDKTWDKDFAKSFLEKNL